MKKIMHINEFGGIWKNFEDVVRRNTQMIWTKMIERKSTRTTTASNTIWNGMMLKYVNDDSSKKLNEFFNVTGLERACFSSLMVFGSSSKIDSYMRCHANEPNSDESWWLWYMRCFATVFISLRNRIEWWSLWTSTRTIPPAPERFLLFNVLITAPERLLLPDAPMH